jgi:hypothetical protein
MTALYMLADFSVPPARSAESVLLTLYQTMRNIIASCRHIITLHFCLLKPRAKSYNLFINYLSI